MTSSMKSLITTASSSIIKVYYTTQTAHLCSITDDKPQVGHWKGKEKEKQVINVTLTINQSINYQSIDQSINQSLIDRSINQSINQSINY